MTKIKTTPYDGSKFLSDPADQVDILNDALESGSPTVVALALRDIAKARGMTDVAKKVGITRAGLYRALSETGDPKLTTLLGVLSALKLELAVRPAKAGAAAKTKQMPSKRAAKTA